MTCEALNSLRSGWRAWTGTAAISTLDMRTGRERVVGRGLDAVWSPDGRQIVYDARGAVGSAALYVLDPRSHRARKVSTPGLTQAGTPVWSPDGRSLAFFGTASTARTFIQPYGVWTVSVSGGRPHPVVANAAPYLPVGQEALAWADR